MVPRLLTITGPSGAGKSELVKIIQGLESPGFHPVLIPKFTTRPARSNDGPEVRCVDAIPPGCDIAYEQYGVRYGLRSRILWNNLMAGRAPVVILNDVRAVEDVHIQFGGIAKAVYVFREAPSYNKLMSLSHERGATEGDEYSKRYLKAIMIHRIYIENVQLFDWVILNVRKGLESMEQQMRNLLAFDGSTTRELRSREDTKP